MIAEPLGLAPYKNVKCVLFPDFSHGIHIGTTDFLFLLVLPFYKWYITILSAMVVQVRH